MSALAIRLIVGLAEPQNTSNYGRLGLRVERGTQKLRRSRSQRTNNHGCVVVLMQPHDVDRKPNRGDYGNELHSLFGVRTQIEQNDIRPQLPQTAVQLAGVRVTVEVSRDVKRSRFRYRRDKLLGQSPVRADKNRDQFRSMYEFVGFHVSRF